MTDIRQWPDVRLYFPPLLRSVMGTSKDEQLLARVDYELVSNKVTCALPSLRSVGVESRVGEAGADGLQEVIVRYWLAYAALPL